MEKQFQNVPFFSKCNFAHRYGEDDEWAAQPEEATRFGKVVRGGGKRDDQDEEIKEEK